MGRPLSLTMICLLVWVGSVMALLAAFRQDTRDLFIAAYGTPAFLLAMGLVLATFVAAIGCWNMQRWGVYLATAAVVIGLVSKGLTQGLPSLATLNSLGSLLFPMIGWIHLRKM